MRTNTKIFLVMYIAAILTVIFEAPIHKLLEIDFFSKLGLMYILSRACLVVVGGAIGFRLANDLTEKNAKKTKKI